MSKRLRTLRDWLLWRMARGELIVLNAHLRSSGDGLRMRANDRGLVRGCYFEHCADMHGLPGVEWLREDPAALMRDMMRDLDRLPMVD